MSLRTEYSIAIFDIQRGVRETEASPSAQNRQGIKTSKKAKYQE